VCCQVLHEELFGLVLRESERERVRRRCLCAFTRQRKRGRSPAPFINLDGAGLHSARDGCFGQAEPVQQLQGAHMHQRRPRLVHRAGLTVQNLKVHTVLGE
jgi:hypothetical protein